MNLPMDSVPVPSTVRRARPDVSVQLIGPPTGISPEDCRTVEAAVGLFSGMPAVADYFQPDAHQIAALSAGGCIEFIQFGSQMVMHAVNVWPAGPPSRDDLVAAIRDRVATRVVEDLDQHRVSGTEVDATCSCGHRHAPGTDAEIYAAQRRHVADITCASIRLSICGDAS